MLLISLFVFIFVYQIKNREIMRTKEECKIKWSKNIYTNDSYGDTYLNFNTFKWVLSSTGLNDLKLNGKSILNISRDSYGFVYVDVDYDLIKFAYDKGLSNGNFRFNYDMYGSNEIEHIYDFGLSLKDRLSGILKDYKLQKV
jgi:hypothetical protein